MGGSCALLMQSRLYNGLLEKFCRILVQPNRTALAAREAAAAHGTADWSVTRSDGYERGARGVVIRTLQARPADNLHAGEAGSLQSRTRTFWVGAHTGAREAERQNRESQDLLHAPRTVLGLR